MQVIGQHAGGDESFGKCGQRLRVIVHAAQQHRLVEQQHAGLAQSHAGSVHRSVEFVGVVGVQHQHLLQRQGCQPREQVIVDARRQHDGQTGMDAQPLHMRDAGQAVGEFREFGGGQRQRIAAGEDQLVDRGVLPQVIEGLPPLPGGGDLLAIRKMAAETVATVDRATAAGDQERAAMVLVQQARRLARGQIADRIGDEARRLVPFGQLRQNLQQQWIARIAMSHACGKGTRHAQGETGVVHGQPHGQFGQAEQIEQFARVGDRLTPLRAPVFRGLRWAPGRACGYHGRLDRARVIPRKPSF